MAEDLDHDGDIDLATAGKLGVHFLENLKIATKFPRRLVKRSSRLSANGRSRAKARKFRRRMGRVEVSCFSVAGNFS